MDRNEALQRHKDLTEEGWVRRFTAEEPRLSEMRDLYASLGLEVLVESAFPCDDRECSVCFDSESLRERYKTIYTRGEVSGAGLESEDLFE